MNLCKTTLVRAVFNDTLTIAHCSKMTTVKINLKCYNEYVA